MPCYHPLTGYRARSANPSGKRSIVFNFNQGFKDLPVVLPCGQCIGCKLEYSRQWAIRLMHEASLHEKNCFLTLTYSPEKIPRFGSLRYEDMQLFWKRLRKFIGRSHKIKYYQCGEYGERTLRPHYHAALFNYDFRDKEVLFRTRSGFIVHTSKKLEDLWGHGQCSIGELTFESAAYVARYVTKKISGEQALHHYNKIDLDTGEILQERRPEKASMSNGLALEWFNRFKSDVFPRDAVILRGRKLRPPKYYSARYEAEFPQKFSKIKAARKRAGERCEDDNTRDRLDVREECHYRKIENLKRSFESDS